MNLVPFGMKGSVLTPLPERDSGFLRAKCVALIRSVTLTGQREPTGALLVHSGLQMGSSSATEHILSWSKDANCGSTATWRRLQQCYKPRRNQLISQPTDFGEALTRQIPRCDDEF